MPLFCIRLVGLNNYLDIVCIGLRLVGLNNYINSVYSGYMIRLVHFIWTPKKYMEKAEIFFFLRFKWCVPNESLIHYFPFCVNSALIHLRHILRRRKHLWICSLVFQGKWYKPRRFLMKTCQHINIKTC